MGRGSALLAVAASAVLLAGCAQGTALPQGLSDDEVTAMLTEQSAMWWRMAYPDESPPQVEVVEYIYPFGPSTAVKECVVAAHVPGLTVQNGGWTFESNDPVAERLFALAQYTCSMKYPYDPAYAEQMGLYSDEQLRYLYDYFTQRLEPCLVANGQSVIGRPSLADFMASAPYMLWNPYDSIVQPTTAEAWHELDYRCPPPPVGHFWRAGIDYETGS